jgi:hypothetical protein
MIIQSAWQVAFDFYDPKPLVVEPQQAQLTSDAGLSPIRQLDEQLGLTAQFAAAIHDPRDQRASVHSVAEMVRMRIYGILADYADQNDHDVLRFDPLFKLLVGRSPEDQELASQPTLSRFENAVDIASLRRLQDVLVEVDPFV